MAIINVSATDYVKSTGDIDSNIKMASGEDFARFRDSLKQHGTIRIKAADFIDFVDANRSNIIVVHGFDILAIDDRAAPRGTIRLRAVDTANLTERLSRNIVLNLSPSDDLRMHDDTHKAIEISAHDDISLEDLAKHVKWDDALEVITISESSVGVRSRPLRETLTITDTVICQSIRTYRPADVLVISDKSRGYTLNITKVYKPK